jgi:hypothetical protein
MDMRCIAHCIVMHEYAIMAVPSHRHSRCPAIARASVQVRGLSLPAFIRHLIMQSRRSEP